MIITLVGNTHIPSDIQRLLFGITAYLIPEHDIRIVLGRRGGYEATYAAVERALIEGEDVELQAYPATLDRIPFIVEDYVMEDVVDFYKRPYSDVLESMVSKDFINRERLGAHICAVLGPDLKEPSDVVVYAGDINDDTNEYRCLKGASRREGIEFLNISDPEDIIRLFELVTVGEQKLYAVR